MGVPVVPRPRRAFRRLGRTWLPIVLAAVWASAFTVGGRPADTADSAYPAILEAGSGAPGGDLTPQPVDVAVLVDESGSIKSPGDVTLHREQDAASLIALGELSAQSKVAVVGFGGATRAGQTPVDPVCPLMAVDPPANRAAIESCVSNLKVRTDAEGNNTDFIAAIEEGLHQLGSAGDSNPKFIFILTDGVLDVWVGDPDAPYSSLDAAQQALDQVALPEARAQGVQIWPLGFGEAKGSSLQHLADGGAPIGSSCAGAAGSSPPARIATDDATVAETMVQAFAMARCFVPVLNGPTPPPADLAVDVPSIATDASLLVLRRNTTSEVTFVDPDNRTVTEQDGSYGGSTFKLTGTDSSVVALRITDPVTGVWHIHVAAPTVPSASGSDAGQVTAVVLWQSVLRATIVLGTSRPAAGQPVVVSMTLATRRSVIDGLAARGLSASVTVAGSGMAAPITVPLKDAPVASSGVGGNGVFAGSVPIPAGATGTLTFTGSVSGPGVFVPGTAQAGATVTGRPSPVTAKVVFDQVATVRQGGSVHGHVYVTNTGSSTASLPLSVTAANTHGDLGISPKSVPVPADGQGSTDFTLSVGRNMPLGPLAVTVHAADASTGTSFDQPFNIDVVAPPSWISEHWPELLGLLLAGLIALVGLGVLRGRRLHAVDVTDLMLRLFGADPGQPLSVYRVEPNRPSSSAKFAIRDAQSANPRFDEVSPDGDAPYEVRRVRRGQGITVRVPEGDVLTILPGRQEPITDRLRLGYEDRRADDNSDPGSTGIAASGGERPEYGGYGAGTLATTAVIDYGGPDFTGDYSGALGGDENGGAPRTAPTGDARSGRGRRFGRRAREDAERPSPTYDD